MPEINDSASFPDADDLICFHTRESLDLLGCRPLDLDRIYDFRLAQTEMQSQISLRHYA